ncbi:hypothetical protein Tco_0362996 [Tanacetum coccineum]
MLNQQLSPNDISGCLKQVQTVLTVLPLRCNSIVLLLLNKQSLPTTLDDEDLLQLMKMLMEEIDIRWQCGHDNCKDKEVYEGTGRPIEPKPKNGLPFDKSKIANESSGKENCAIEDSKLKAFGGQQFNNEDIDGNFNAEHVHFGQDGLGDFDWSNKADDTSVSLALMATNSEMEYDLKIRDLKLEEKQKELDQALKERDDFKVKLEKWSNASVLQNEVLNKQRYLSDKSCIGFRVESSSGMESDNSSGNTNSTESLIDELSIRNKSLIQENTKVSHQEIDRYKVIIEDWVDSDDEETVLNSLETQKKTVFNSENSETSFENRSPSSQNSVGQESRKTGFGHKRGNPEEDIKGGYVALEMTLKEEESREKGTIKESCIDFEKVAMWRSFKFNLLSVYQICDKRHKILFPSGGIHMPGRKGIKRTELSYGTRRLGHVSTQDLNKLVRAIWLVAYLPRTFKLDHHVWHVERVNITGLLARRWKEERSENSRIAPYDLFGTCFSRGW